MNIQHRPDYIGLIFYSGSKRNAANIPVTETEGLIRTGVFVDEEIDLILKTAEKHHLQALQLHGEESPEFCLQLKKKGFRILKALAVNCKEDLEASVYYEGNTDLLVLDAKGEKRGGNGISFDHSILRHYPSTLPFLLSGGLKPQDAEYLLKLKSEIPQMAGVDINSGFETEPGNKDLDLINTFIAKLKKS